MKSCLALLTVFSSLMGCGEKDEPIPARPDAMPMVDAMPVNKLGALCTVPAVGVADPCGSGHICVTLVAGQANGYCSPLCNATEALCDMGYTGPAGGDPKCAARVPANNATLNACVILCTVATECPNDLPCETIPNVTPPAKSCFNL